MSPREVVIVAALSLSACYVGLDGDPLAGSSGAASSGGEVGPGSASDAPTSAGPGSAPGTTDMSAGPGGDSDEPDSTGAVVTGGPMTTEATTGGPMTTEPGTSGPTTEPMTTEPGTTDDTNEPPPDEAALLCQRWNADRAQLGEGTWSGSAAGCDKGAVSQDGRDNALRQVNLYRWIADLPPVAEDAGKTGSAQSCALMMHANGQLSHTPPDKWKCYTADGAGAAGKSNISGGPGVFSVDLYMIDVGNETTMGHRRWILSNSLGSIGLGSTSMYSCLYVIGGGGNAGKPWMAWPSPGLVPLQAMYVDAVNWSDVDAAGWTVQSDSIELGAATVSVKEGGVDKPVTVNGLGANYGSTSAVRFVPKGWKVEAGKTYDVTLGNVSQAIAYSVTIVDCG